MNWGITPLVPDIITIAQDMDEKLVQSSGSVPTHWTPCTADTISRYVREAGMYGELCLVHSNMWAANAWSRYRTVRVAVQTIILQHVDRLSAPAAQIDSIICHAQTSLQLEVNGLCAYVPFYLGSRDTHATTEQALIEFPECNEFIMSEQTREQLILLGEWSLFWPLSRMVQNLRVLSKLGRLCIPDNQFRWAQDQVVRCGRRAQTRSPLGGDF
jgi:hypothetical protein